MTDLVEFIVTIQVGTVPAQSPAHPIKIELSSGTAVKVTVVPKLNEVPVGLVETLPTPVPVYLRVRVLLPRSLKRV